MRSETARSISSGDAALIWSAGRLTTGRSTTPAGKSHSCDRPTSSSPAPSMWMISVPAGRNETMRMSLDVDGKPTDHEPAATVCESGVAARGFIQSARRWGPVCAWAAHTHDIPSTRSIA